MKVINDLYDYENLKIVQNSKNFKFSLDSILLAEFVKFKNNKSLAIDFCTGNAPVPLILSTKTKSKIFGIEIQKKIFEYAVESIVLNKLDRQIEIVNDNINNIKSHFDSEVADVVTCNPPYFKVGADSLLNSNYEKAVARHELSTNLDSIIKSASYVLKNKGEFYLVHRPERLEEIVELMRINNLSVKILQFVYANFDKDAIIVLIKAVKNGKIGMKVLKPICIEGQKTYQNLVGE